MALTTVSVVALAACGTNLGDKKTTSQKESIGAGEGKLSVLVWPGYAEDGSNDPSVDWVTPFEQQTGCQVFVKPFGTSDEAVTLMRTGQYDVVSASGDASLRLIAGRDVDPVNTSLLKNYADIYPFLRDKEWNTVKGTNYGVPHGWGANVLTYRTDIVKPAPTSWNVVFADASAHQGKVTAYDSPIYIADAAVYLMAHRPELGIKNPYALDETQLQAAVDLLKKQRASIGEYWSDVIKEAQAFGSGSTVVGSSWQVGVGIAAANGTPIASVLPSEGATGWSDTWMIGSRSKHKNCAYKWIDYIVSPKPNAQVAEYFGESPANPKACGLTVNKQHCAMYHSGDVSYAEKIWYWTTPITHCLDGRTETKCTDYSAWAKAWTGIKG